MRVYNNKLVLAQVARPKYAGFVSQFASEKVSHSPAKKIFEAEAMAKAKAEVEAKAEAEVEGRGPLHAFI